VICATTSTLLLSGLSPTIVKWVHMRRKILTKRCPYAIAILARLATHKEQLTSWTQKGTEMALVTFRNTMGFLAYLHMRIGPVDRHPDNRGSANTTCPAGGSIQENVGDGDVWYAFGRREIGGAENPPLCNAPGGSTAILSEDKPCFVNN
jgi:hypothetical protein